MLSNRTKSCVLVAIKAFRYKYLYDIANCSESYSIMVISMTSIGPKEVKVFRVTGEIKKPNYQTSFRKEVRALKPENAVEKVYKELGSKHRVKRFQIKIVHVEEISAEKIENPVIKKLTLGEEESVQ